MAKRGMRIGFPLGGLNVETAYRQQKPYETFDCLNVVPVGVFEGRERGGSRWGLVASHGASLGDEIRFANSMTLALGDGFTNWSDTFDGNSLQSLWSRAPWVVGLPSVSDSKAIGTYAQADPGILRDMPSLDWTSTPLVFESYLVPHEGQFNGKYNLFLTFDDGGIEDVQVEFQLVMDDATGDYAGTLKIDGDEEGDPFDQVSEVFTPGSNGSAEPGWFTVEIATDGAITVKWRGTTIHTVASNGLAIPAGGGSYFSAGDLSNFLKVGFGMECTVEDQQCQASIFRIQYTSSVAVDPHRSMLVAGSGGDVYYESQYGAMTVVTSALSIRDDTELVAAQNGQKLYIADYGDVRAYASDGVISGATLDSATYTDWSTLSISTDDDVCVITNVGGATVAGNYTIASVAAGAVTLNSSPGDGTCTFRIERAPKIFDPSDNTLSMLASTSGHVPIGCPVVWRHLGSLMLAGAETNPSIWYKSRQFDEQDWDYSKTDNQRAVAGNNSDAGIPGAGIVAGAPHGDDYSIIGCRNELWRMRGDPAYGGQLDNLSYEVGIVGPNAWCVGPSGEFVFLSLDGIYMLQPGGNSFPESVSREKMPIEFEDLDTSSNTFSMEYDMNRRGAHIYITPDSYNDSRHLFFDWKRKTFWPVSLASDHEPMCACVSMSAAAGDVAVIHGCRDGALRKYDRDSWSDDGTAFSSYVNMGPVPLAQDSQIGRLLTLEGIMAADSNDVTWSVHPSDTYEGATTATSTDSGTWVAGQNTHVRPSCRGQTFMLKITGTAAEAWVIEHVVAFAMDAGRRKTV